MIIIQNFSFSSHVCSTMKIIGTCVINQNYVWFQILPQLNFCSDLSVSELSFCFWNKKLGIYLGEPQKMKQWNLLRSIFLFLNFVEYCFPFLLCLSLRYISNAWMYALIKHHKTYSWYGWYLRCALLGRETMKIKTNGACFSNKCFLSAIFITNSIKW